MYMSVLFGCLSWSLNITLCGKYGVRSLAISVICTARKLVETKTENIWYILEIEFRQYNMDFFYSDWKICVVMNLILIFIIIHFYLWQLLSIANKVTKIYVFFLVYYTFSTVLKSSIILLQICANIWRQCAFL